MGERQLRRGARCFGGVVRVVRAAMRACAALSAIFDIRGSGKGEREAGEARAAGGGRRREEVERESGGRLASERKCGALHRGLAAVEGPYARSCATGPHPSRRPWGRWAREMRARAQEGARGMGKLLGIGKKTHGDALDVVAKDLAVALGAALAEALAALAASGHFLMRSGGG